MEKHTCKLCFRSFANGRALGGHMRSHVAATTKAAAAAAAAAEGHFSPSPLPSSSSTSSEEDGYGLRENPKKSVRLLYPEVSVDAAEVVQDRESETEYSRPTAAHRGRSKRARPVHAEPEPVSSVSDTTAEEDVAISLMMLSRDAWKDTEVDVGDDDEEEEELVVVAKKQHRPPVVKGRSKYQCCTCKKVFRSYQALGGHRASHKKFKSCVPPPLPPPQNARCSGGVQIHETESSCHANAEKLVHACPVCFRVFASGQALGGHKRSHLTPSAAAAAATTPITITSSSSSMIPPLPLPTPAAAAAAATQNVLIDLNLPAPMEEDADQLSAVSDELNWVQRGN